MTMKEIFSGVFKEGRKLYTLNSNPGKRVYGEKLIKENGKEFREWVAERSKLAAAISNRLRNFPFNQETKVLYLGASTGTTISHLSDICRKGNIYAIEFSERVFHNLISLAKSRKNIVPIMADARKTNMYRWVEEVDVVFCDISQPDEIEIALRNSSEFLKKDGILMVSVKSQSIDVTKKSSVIYEQAKEKISKQMSVIEIVDLEPFEKNHALIVAKN